MRSPRSSDVGLPVPRGSAGAEGAGATGGLCLQCHGEAIAPPVAEKISALYPDDKATGFREGDIRGAFVVIRKID